MLQKLKPSSEDMEIKEGRSSDNPSTTHTPHRQCVLVVEGLTIQLLTFLSKISVQSELVEDDGGEARQILKVDLVAGHEGGLPDLHTHEHRQVDQDEVGVVEAEGIRALHTDAETLKTGKIADLAEVVVREGARVDCQCTQFIAILDVEGTILALCLIVLTQCETIGSDLHRLKIWQSTNLQLLRVHEAFTANNETLEALQLAHREHSECLFVAAVVTDDQLVNHLWNTVQVHGCSDRVRLGHSLGVLRVL